MLLPSTILHHPSSFLCCLCLLVASSVTLGFPTAALPAASGQHRAGQDSDGKKAEIHDGGRLSDGIFHQRRQGEGGRFLIVHAHQHQQQQDDDQEKRFEQ